MEIHKSCRIEAILSHLLDACPPVCSAYLLLLLLLLLLLWNT